MPDVFSKLRSPDFNTRIQAAAELGEYKNKDHAPLLLDMAWNDEVSNVQQVSIQAYTEIMESEAYPEIIKIINEHKDDYVIQYAISLLGQFDKDLVTDKLAEILASEDDKLRTTAIRAAIKSNSIKCQEQIMNLLETEIYPIAIRSGIEALGLWKYKKAKDLIYKILEEKGEDLEIKTFSLFALAAFGDKKSEKKLKTDEIDPYARITVNGIRYSGREGLLLALKEI